MTNVPYKKIDDFATSLISVHEKFRNIGNFGTSVLLKTSYDIPILD